MGELYGEREAEIGRSLKSKRVQESRDRESTEGSDSFFYYFFYFFLFYFFVICCVLFFFDFFFPLRC